MSLEGVKIALVELSPTLAAALASWLESEGGAAVAVCVGTDAADVADIIITDPLRLLAHLDFYLPRKSKVAALCLTRQGSETSLPVSAIYLDDPAEETLRRISALARRDAAAANDYATSLTAREIDVLKGVASGKTNKEIADELCISVNTVITHRKNVTGKLGIRSTSGLSLYAMMNGLL